VGRHIGLTRDRDFVLWLALIGALGFIIRIANAFWWLDFHIAGDSLYYYGQANALAHGHLFVQGIDWIHTGATEASALHPPAYTVFLGALSFVGAKGVSIERAASCVVGTGTIVVLGVLGRSLAGRRAGLVVAALAAVTPGLWIADSQLLSEGLYGLALALMLLAAYRYRARPTALLAGGLSAAASLAALTRGEALLAFPLLVVPWIAVRVWRDPRELLRHLAVAVAVAVVLIGPWLGYNAARFGRVTFSDNSGGTLMLTNCDGTYHGSFMGYWSPTCLRRLRGNEADQDAEARTVAIHYMRDHASRVPVVVAARIGRLLDVYRVHQNLLLSTQLEGRGHWQTRAQLFGFYALVALGIPGMVTMRRRRVPQWPLVSVALLAVFAAIVEYGNARFRLPIELSLDVWAGVGLAALTTRRWSRPRAMTAETTEPVTVGTNV
jgi:4-amino-4-deoxy-L-arabinose transferase-like glycosyltransferase